MLYLLIGLALFIGIHLVRIVAPGFRASMINKIGDGGWKGIYSIIAILGVYVITLGFTDVKLGYDELYDPPLWLRHPMMLLVLIAFIFMIAGNFRNGYIKAKIKHPMLIGLKTWAFAHLLVNGDVASVILFGSLLAWAVYALIAIKKRGEPPIEVTTVVPDIVAVVVGSAIWFVFAYYLHVWLFGVPVFG